MPNRFEEDTDQATLLNMARLLNYVASTCDCERCSSYRYISEPYLYNESTETSS